MTEQAQGETQGRRWQDSPEGIASSANIGDYIEYMERRLADAKQRAETAEKELAEHKGTSPIWVSMDDYDALRAQLAKAERKAARYREALESAVVKFQRIESIAFGMVEARAGDGAQEAQDVLDALESEDEPGKGK